MNTRSRAAPRFAFALATLGAGAACGAAMKVTDLVTGGEAREQRKRADDAPRTSAGHPPILFIALDGVDRHLLYELLRKNELPALEALLGGSEGRFPHACFDETLLSTLPSSTMAAWTTAMTGVPPATHGVTGNEFFIREERRLAAPAPVSFDDSKTTLSIYTDGYLDALKKAPSVYDRMREREPDILIWVAMHQIFSGADKLIVTKPTILVQAFEHFFEQVAAGARVTRDGFKKLDEQVVSAVVTELEHGDLPDVLAIYLPGTDLYAHVADEGPDEARKSYLKEIVDPALAKLLARLRDRHALDDRYIIVTADHGHTEVVRDDAHALSAQGPAYPPALMKKAGYRVRPFSLDVSEKDDFDSVLVEGGAMAYVYVADRSTCAATGTPCDWARPPRFEEDVVPMAEAFYKNNEDGSSVPEMKGTLDLVLTRHPKPVPEVDLPFEVYVGSGKTVPLEVYLSEHPHPTYIDAAARFRDLAVGPRGERAGDILLLAHNGDRKDPADRFYFASPYRSWHGSPSRQDSEIPLIVGNPRRTSESIHTDVTRVLGGRPYQQKITDLLLDLRSSH